MYRGLSFLIACVGLVAVAGCSGKSPVSGSVTLDGNPLPGATVVFTSDDGKIASGVTDESGNFSLQYQNAPGIPSGTYKVSVTKTKGVQEAGSPDSMDKAYLAEMQKRMAAKSGPGGGLGGVAGPPPGMAKKGSGTDQSELPGVYATAATTPITIQVPAKGSVTIELKSKP